MVLSSICPQNASCTTRTAILLTSGRWVLSSLRPPLGRIRTRSPIRASMCVGGVWLCVLLLGACPEYRVCWQMVQTIIESEAPKLDSGTEHVSAVVLRAVLTPKHSLLQPSSPRSSVSSYPSVSVPRCAVVGGLCLPCSVAHVAYVVRGRSRKHGCLRTSS